MAVKDKLKRCYFMIQEVSDPVFVVWIILSPLQWPEFKCKYKYK